MKAPILASLTIALSTSLAACSWVKPSSASQRVVLASEADVAECTRKGVTTSKTLGKFLFIPRGKEKVFTELVTLAKNEAVILGGDTVVPQGTAEDGEQKFTVYQCRG